MKAAAYIATQRDPLGEPELQFWFFSPMHEELDYQTPEWAWFKSMHTGSGRCSPYFTGATDDEVEKKAKSWRYGLSEREEYKLGFKGPA